MKFDHYEVVVTNKKFDDDSLHQIRVTIKRLRVVLRALKKNQQPLRTISHKLAPLRDEKIFNKLAKKYSLPVKLPVKSPQKRFENSRIKKLMTQARTEIAKTIAVMLNQMSHLKKDRAFKAEAKRLKKQIRKRHTFAETTHKPSDYHELRKSVKSLYYLLELNGVKIRHQKKTLALLKKWGKCLGHLHDIDVFLKYVTHKLLKKSFERHQKFSQAIDQKKKYLVKQSCRFGKKMAFFQ